MDNFDIRNCEDCRCYTCAFNGHAKPDESCHVDVGRIQAIPIAKRCIGCSYCYINQRQTKRIGCCNHSEVRT